MHSVIGIEAFDQSQVHGKVPQQPKLPTTLHALRNFMRDLNAKFRALKCNRSAVKAGNLLKTNIDHSGI
jgi:hypothetical protein